VSFCANKHEKRLYGEGVIQNFVLIIGAMKSGTTTLYDYLAQHPQIAVGSEKEPSFFAFEERWALGFDWYESKFSYDPNRHLYALDGSTDYTKHPFCEKVVERLKASAPRRFKLIYIMRHPLRRIESHARHAETFKREIGRCLSPREAHGLDAGISPVSMAISRYAYQIDKYLEYYDKGDLLLLTLEQLAREPGAVLAKVCKFLELDAASVGETLLKSNVAERKASSHSLSRSLYAHWQTLKGITPLRRLVKSVVPRSLRARVYSEVKTMAGPQGRFVLNEREADAVTAILIPDLIRLRDRYGIDAEKEWGIALPTNADLA